MELVLGTGPPRCWRCPPLAHDGPALQTLPSPSLSAPPSLWLGTRLEEKTLSVGTSSLGKFLSVSACL